MVAVLHQREQNGNKKEYTNLQNGWLYPPVVLLKENTFLHAEILLIHKILLHKPNSLS